MDVNRQCARSRKGSQDVDMETSEGVDSKDKGEPGCSNRKGQGASIQTPTTVCRVLALMPTTKAFLRLLIRVCLAKIWGLFQP